MAKQRRQKLHRVSCNMQVIELTRSGSSMNLQIWARNKKIGEIKLGRGSFTWYGNKWKRGRRLSWSKFAEWMDKTP